MKKKLLKATGMLLMMMLVGSAWGQDFSETFGTIADGTVITTSNTSFDEVYIGTLQGSIQAKNPSNFTGSSARVFGMSTKQAALVEKNITSGDLITISFDIRVINSTGRFYVFAGNGLTGSTEYSGATTLLGVRLYAGEWQSHTRPASTNIWTAISGVENPSINTNYNVHIVANGTASSQDYGSYTIAAGKGDIFIDGVLKGDDFSISDKDIMNSFKLGQTGNALDDYEIDNINVWYSCIAPPTPGLWKTIASTTDWATASNWDDGNVPTSATNVTIPTGASNYPTISAAATCNNITIENGATLLGENNLTVSGTATVQQSISGYTGATDGWNVISAPVSGMAMAGSDFVPVSGEDDFYAYDQAENLWRNYLDGTNDPSWFDNFDIKTGYLVAYALANAGTKNFVGALNSDASYVANLSNTNTSWNLIGNHIHQILPGLALL